MKSILEIELHEKKVRYWLVSIVLSLVVVSVLLFASTQENKWLLASMLAIIGVFICFVIQKKLWRLLLLLIVFVIPLRIDFYLLYKPTYFVQTHGFPGLPVNLFDIVLVVVVCYFCFQILRGESKFYFYPSISIPALVYIILSGISAFHSADWSLSFTVFVLMIKSYLAFLFFANRIKTRDDLSLVLLALMAGVLFQSFVGALQYVSDGGFLKGVFGIPEGALMAQIQGDFILSRVGGTIGHPNALAKYLCFCIPVLLSYSFGKFNVPLRVLAFAATIAAGLTLVMTMSRGSWVALGLTFVFLFYEMFRRYFKSRTKAIVAVILVNTLLAGATLALFEDVRTRLFKDDYGRAEARLPMAMIALDIIKTHPIKGVGLNNYTSVMHTYDHTREWQTYKFPHPVHNSYLLIAAESGIPTLLAFLWLIGSVFVKAWPAIKRFNSSISLLQAGWIGGLMTWLISGMFDRDFAGTNVMLWFTIALVVATSRVLAIENERDTVHET